MKFKLFNDDGSEFEYDPRVHSSILRMGHDHGVIIIMHNGEPAFRCNNLSKRWSVNVAAFLDILRATA